MNLLPYRLYARGVANGVKRIEQPAYPLVGGVLADELCG
jgi:hypothetical protein